MKNKTSVIMLIDGLPRARSVNEVLVTLQGMGVDAVCFDHPGFSESSEFLTLENIVEKYSKHLETLAKQYEKVNIVANSFGAYILSHINCLHLAEKIVMISPAFDLKSVPKIETLDDFVKTREPMARINKEDWLNIVNTPANIENLRKVNDRSLIIAGENDEDVSIDNLREHCQSTQIRLKIEPKGHIGLSKFEQEEYNEIEEFFGIIPPRNTLRTQTQNQ